MIIECSACNSRFRLDESKITGRGARVRCRKCGEPITVMKDNADAQGGTGAAGSAEQEEGLDLRSILRESMDAPLAPAPMSTDGQVPRAQDAQKQPPPAAETPGPDALQSDFEKMMTDAGKEANAETAAPQVAEPPAPALGGTVLRSTEGTSAAMPAPERPTADGQTVDFGPEEELTFLQQGRKEPAPTDARALQSAARAGAATSTEGHARPGAMDGGSGRPPDAQAPPAQPAAPASSSEFMMSTADSLDFLKADYDQKEQNATLDITGNLRIAPAPGAGDAGVVPPLGIKAAPAGQGWPSAATPTDGQVPREPGWRERPGAGGAGAAAAEPPAEPPSRSDAIRSELAGLGSAGAAAAESAAAGKTPAAGPGRPGAGSAGAAAPPRAGAAGPPPLRETAAPRPSPAVRRAPGTRSPPLKRGQASQLVRPSVVLLLLLFFALAGGGAYLGFTSDGQKVLRGLVPQIESLWLGGGKPASSRYEVGNLIGYYEANAAAGRMFVIKGQVTNEGQLRKTGIRVSATLLDAQNKKVAEKTVYAGNVLAGDALRKAAREKIEAAMSNPIGGGLANMDIPPGKAVPFMVVFFDAPDGIDSYRLEPKDVD